MVVYGVENDLWDLRTRGIVKEDKVRTPIQGWKGGANVCNGKAA
jgi:hypothetical protein